jgi:Flp pilus assembly protein TadD
MHHLVERRGKAPARRKSPSAATRLRPAPCLAAAFGFLLLAGCSNWPDKPALPAPTDPPPEFAARHNTDQDSNSATPPAQGKKNSKETAALAEYGAQLMKGKDAEKHGNLQEARTVYEAMITGYPQRYEAYHRLAVVADRHRRYQEAQALYTQAIRLNSRNPDLFNDLGYCFYLQGKMEKAESALLKAVSMRPAEPRYRNNLGLAYGMQGRDEEALAEYRRAGSEGDAYYNLAFVKAARNDLPGAKDCFHRALAADPTHERARQALTSFEAADSQPEYLHNVGPLADEGVTWVPFVENDDNQHPTAPADGAKTTASATHATASSHSATHNLIGKAQAYSAANSENTPR